MTRSIALVGGGPRAVAVVSRLCATSTVISAELPLTIHLIDAVEPGAGRTWRTDQNRFLLCNTYAAETTVFADASIPTLGPSATGPSLDQWLDEVLADPDSFDDWIAAEASWLHAWSYPPRSLQGSYFRWALDRIISQAPAHVSVEMTRATVVSLDEGESGEQLLTCSDGSALKVDAVILLQGLLTSGRAAEVNELTLAANRAKLTYVPPGMPSEQNWDVLGAGERVLVRGLGANFFDAIGILFEGRGGRFSRDAVGTLHYHPSGREPFLSAGSRHGLPYRAKAYYSGGLPGPCELPRFSAEREASLLRQYGGTKSVDFAQELADDVIADFRDIFQATARAVGSDEARFDWDEIVYPATITALANQAEWSAFFDRYSMSELASIHTPESSPSKAVHRAVETARRRLSRLVIAGVFDPVSVVRDLKGNFLPRSLVTSSGPPPERAEQLFALCRAGYIEILGPGLKIECHPDGFVATSSLPDQRRVAGALLEARMDLGDLRSTDDPLVRHLLETGQARFYSVTDADGTVMTTGTLDVTSDNFLLVDAQGTPHPRRIVLGSPAGDVQFNTAIGAIPHTGDKMLVGAERAAVCALTAISY